MSEHGPSGGDCALIALALLLLVALFLAPTLLFAWGHPVWGAAALTILVLAGAVKS